MHIKPTGRIPNNLDSDIIYFAKKNMTVSMEMNLSVQSFMQFGKEAISSSVKKLKDYFTKELYYLNEYTDSGNFIANVAAMRTNFSHLEKAINKTNHLDMVDFSVFIPEGMNCTYLEQLNILIPAGEFLNTYLYKTIDALNIKLGELINDNEGLGINVVAAHSKQVIEEKDKLIKLFASNTNSKHETEVPLERVIKRSADWEEIHKKLAIHNNNMDKIKTKDVKDKMTKSNELIDIYIKKKEKKDIDKELIITLSKIVYSSASLVEFYVSIVYDTIAFNNAINDTITKIVKSKKE